jgi:excisionase family DNA binding protein
MLKNPTATRFQDYLTIKEAAELLGVSVATLRNWDRAEKVKACRHPVNGYRLYLREELEALLGRVTPAADSLLCHAQPRSLWRGRPGVPPDDLPLRGDGEGATPAHPGGDGAKERLRLTREAMERAERLSESEERFRHLSESRQAIMNTVAEGLSTVDAQGLMTCVNPAAER